MELEGSSPYLPVLQTNILHSYINTGGMRWRSCATSRKVEGPIPDGVIWIFHWHNPSGRNGVYQAYDRNEYQEYFLAVNADDAYGWNLITDCLEIW
jgi:hypothetical protein